jgi:PAS domain S-box-containing protein
MDGAIKILIVEDLPTDAELAEREIKRVLPQSVFLRVETREDFLAALTSFRPELILSDYKMPRFDGLSALKLALEHTPETPFIMVTGSMNEETAVACMKAGAWDYVIKEHIKRLGPAVLGGLEQKRLRRERKQAEEALRESEDRYRDLVENSQDLICTHDLEGRILSLNPRPAQILGYTRNDLLQMNFQDILVPEKRHLFGEYLKEIKTKGVSQGLMSVLTAKGEERIWEFNNTLRTEGVTEPIVRGMARDVTEQKRVEDALRRSETLLKQTQQITKVGGWEYNLKKGRLSWTDEVYRIYGVSPERYDPNDITQDLTFYEDRGAIEQAFGRAVELGESYELDLKFINAQGKNLWVRTSGNAEVKDGRVVRVIGYIMDITDRKQAEVEQERLLLAIEQAGEMIVITDSTGTILYVNPAFERMTGFSRQEAIGQNQRIVKSGKQDEAFYRALWETISAGRTWKGRMVNKCKDGTFFTEEATISPVKDSAGRILNYVAVKHDITEHLHLAEQLQQAQKMESVGRLAGGVAHDFNNLLTAIIGNAQMALTDLNKESPLYEFLEEIRGAGERAAMLTRQLLAFSRKQIFKPEVVNLNEVIPAIGSILKRLIGEDIVFKTVLAPELGQVEADEGQIEQVIMNLAVNARDAMPEGGQLTIETADVELDDEYAAAHVSVTPGPYVMVSVSDSGIGISSEIKAKIFDPFFTTKEKDKGTGLGLSTVYGIVKQSKGNIWVYSELGQGTTFKIYLPRIDRGVEEGQGKELKSDARSGSETVLVVEDEESVRTLAQVILQRVGYKVLPAKDGREALEIFESQGDPIDLLLTDVIMPGMNGRELAERLTRVQPGIKVLYMSGYTDNSVVHRGILDKGVAFLQKPFTPKDLARKVREMLDG